MDEERNSEVLPHIITAAINVSVNLIMHHILSRHKCLIFSQVNKVYSYNYIATKNFLHEY